MKDLKLKVMQLGSPTGLYGAERWILALVRHLDPEKITSIVASIKDDAALEVPLCREAHRLGFQTKVFDSPGQVNFSAVTALYRYLKKEKVDILHTHGYKQDMIGLLAARLAGCQILSTPHGWSRDAGFKLQCYEGLNRLIFPFFDAVAPLSPELFEELKKIPGLLSRLRHIPNGVDIGEIDACHSPDKALVEYKQEGAYVIGYIGQMIPRKGIATLLSACAGLSSALNFRVALVGDGPQKGELETLAQTLGIADRVRFFGFRQDRISLLKGFDLFVLPSSLEGIPRCLMEAMAAGVPVLASDIPGTRQLIGDNNHGRLFSVENHHELKALLESMIVSSGEKSSITSSPRQFILKTFSAQRMATDYEKLFEILVNKKSSSEGCMYG